MSGQNAGRATIEVRKGGRIGAAQLNATTKAVLGATGVNGTRVSFQAGKMVIDAGTGGNTRPVAFGVTSVNQTTGKIAIRGGYIIHGQTKVVVGGTEVSVAGGTETSPTFVALRYTYGGNGEILTSTVGDFPLPTATTWEMPILTAYRREGKIRIKEILWTGIVLLPGVYST